jgi:cystathionine beta-lyase/cystathionine gamma-synthase
MSDERRLSKRTPVYRDAGFPFGSIEEAARTVEQELEDPQSSGGFIYTRYGNPTVIETEEAIAKLEGSEWALLTASGMAAIDVALSVSQDPEDTRPWLFFEELYGGTVGYIKEVLEKQRGINIEWFKTVAGEECFDLKKLEDRLKDETKPKPKLIFFEPISNPLLIVSDGEEIIRMAREREIKTVVDNTFATPHLWHPLESGADLVVHSATKYLSGHGNITAGVIIGKSAELKKRVRLYRKFVGNILNADEAYRLGTQLKTFNLRFARQCKNAERLAEVLEKHKAVKSVRYPKLKSHKTHDEALSLFKEKGYGAMISFELEGGQAACERFVEKVSEHISYVITLGDAESILLHVPTVFGEKYEQYEGLIRLSVGFGPYEELKRVVLDALDALSAVAHKTHRIKPVYRVTVFARLKDVSAIQEAVSEAGGAIYGNYADVFWSAEGIEQFTPLAGSSPTVGKEGETTKKCSVEIVFSIEKNESLLEKVLAEIRRVHPWEEPVIYVDDSRASFLIRKNIPDDKSNRP